MVVRQAKSDLHAAEVFTEVVVLAPGQAPLTMVTGDMQDGNISLLSRGPFSLPQGAIIDIALNRGKGATASQLVKARVVTSSKEGISIELL